MVTAAHLAVRVRAGAPWRGHALHATHPDVVAAALRGAGGRAGATRRTGNAKGALRRPRRMVQ